MEELAGKSSEVTIYEEEKLEGGELAEEYLFVDDAEDYPYWDESDIEEDTDNDGD